MAALPDVPAIAETLPDSPRRHGSHCCAAENAGRIVNRISADIAATNPPARVRRRFDDLSADRSAVIRKR